MYQYFLKVVPSSYTDLRNTSTSSNQYSVTEHFKTSAGSGGGAVLPGVFFFYDLSPIKARRCVTTSHPTTSLGCNSSSQPLTLSRLQVSVVESRPSFLHFLTNVCAILGGIFTVSGIVDAAYFHADKIIRQKVQIGKLS